MNLSTLVLSILNLEQMFYKKNFVPDFFKIDQISRINFRKDITGLRALAVISVLFYHAEIKIFKGGWLGVDIFFVISGFLISNIIISELNNNSFSFKNFYTRRVKRIFPALFNMLIFTLPFAYFYLDPKSLLSFTKSLITSVFFVSNIYFKNLDFYNEPPAKLLPLLHTWSLAIEEQFYILIPIIVFILYKYFKNYLVIFLTIIFASSLFLNLLTLNYVNKFYLIQFRIWEILLGFLIMFFNQKLNFNKFENIGFLILLLPIFIFDEKDIIQSEPRLITLFGLTIILLNKNTTGKLSKVLLLNKTTQRIGLISFSIYLIHQPLFAFVQRYYLGRFIKISFSKTIFLILLILILSDFSYRFVEVKVARSKYVYLILFFMFFVILFFSFASYFSKGFESRFEEVNSILAPYYTFQREGVDESYCKKSYNDIYLTDFCFIENNKEADKSLIIIGDSHMITFSKFMYDSLNSDNYNLFILTKQGCPFIFPQLKGTQASCASQNSYDEYNKIVNNSYSITIIGGRFPWYYNGKSFESNLGTTGDDMEPGGELLLNHLKINLDFIIKTSNKLIIIYPIPELGIFPLEAYLSGVYKIDQPLYYDYNFWIDYSSKVNTILDSTESSNVYKIKTHDIFCNSYISNSCIASINQKFYYYDDDHLTYDGSALIGYEVLKILQEINN